MYRALVCVVGIALALIASPLRADEFPSRPIRLIAPFAAGGFVDITARAIAPGMSQALGQQVVVENRPGAGGAIGTQLVAKSTPDGYTLVVSGGGGLIVLPILSSKTAGFDPRRDFTPVSLVTEAPLIMVLGRGTKLNSIPEFIDHAKANPGKLTMGSAGIGTTNHLAGELFQIVTGTKLVHVPYKGSGEALNDLIGGHIDLHFDQIPASIGFIETGQARALGILSVKRSARLPQVPTFEESGHKGLVVTTTLGVLAPPGTPASIVAKLHRAAVAAVENPATREAIQKLGADPLGSTPEQFAKWIADETTRWGEVIKAADIKLEQ